MKVKTYQSEIIQKSLSTYHGFSFFYYYNDNYVFNEHAFYVHLQTN
jgi:hypothetical protein